jgi:hypothetical protein
MVLVVGQQPQPLAHQLLALQKAVRQIAQVETIMMYQVAFLPVRFMRQLSGLAQILKWVER